MLIGGLSAVHAFDREDELDRSAIPPGRYAPPSGSLCLAGPVARPEDGALPLRGDLAHVALADRFLVPHYVAPKVMRVLEEDTPLYRSPARDAARTATLAVGTVFEALDITSRWVWGCCGPEGPTGYVERAALSDDA